MENKQKPSNLYFVPTHHDFDKEGIGFSKEMLDWPIFSHSREKELSDGEYIEIHKEAIEALSLLTPFDSKISIGVDLEKRCLVMPDKRVWGEIYLNGTSILFFSHHTKMDNCAFNSLFEWPEIYQYGQNNPDEELQRVKNILFKWTKEEWKSFFIQRIKERAQFFITKAEAKKKDARELEESALKILLALI